MEIFFVFRFPCFRFLLMSRNGWLVRWRKCSVNFKSIFLDSPSSRLSGGGRRLNIHFLCFLGSFYSVPTRAISRANLQYFSCEIHFIAGRKNYLRFLLGTSFSDVETLGKDSRFKLLFKILR